MRNTFLLIILFAVILSPIIGHSQQPGWQWLNPKPQGNSVSSIYFTSTLVGYAATRSNAVMKTTDGGISWKLTYILAEIYLQEVQFLNPQTGYISTGSNKLVKTTNAGMTWEVIDAIRPDLKFRNIHFRDVNTGYATYDSLYSRRFFVGKTTDGGMTWNEVRSDTIVYHSKIKTNGEIIYLAYSKDTTFSNYVTHLDKSINGGSSWTHITSFLKGVKEMSFTSSDTGYIYLTTYINSGSSNTYKTTNGGINWNIIDQNRPGYYFQAIDNSNLFQASLYYPLELYYSSNGGVLWQSKSIPYPPPYYTGAINYSNFHFKDLNTGFLAGPNIIRTTNNGLNWTDYYSQNIYAHFWAMDFTDANTGFLCGEDNKVYKTTNGGSNWEVNFTHSESYEDMQFVDSQTGYMGCFFDGSIAKTTNCGASWDTMPAIWYGITALDFVNPNTGYLTAKYGPVAKTTNGGLNWESLTDIYGQSFDIDFIDSNNGLVASGGTFKRTNDGGESWDSISIPIDSYVYKMKYVNKNEILAGTLGSGYQNSYILKSSDGGINWYVAYITTEGVGEIEVKGDVAYAIGYSTGKIFKSTDRGNTWRTYNTISNGGAYKIKFANENTGYICGYGGKLIKTTNGGFDPIGIEPISAEIPSGFTLHQNYPNPFNPSTKIKFEIPKASLVRLTVYDILGRQVAELVNQNLNAGTFEYELSAAGGGVELSSGIYFYKLEAGDFVETKRMVLIK